MDFSYVHIRYFGGYGYHICLQDTIQSTLSLCLLCQAMFLPMPLRPLLLTTRSGFRGGQQGSGPNVTPQVPPVDTHGATHQPHRHGNTCCVSSITMLCMTHRSTNLLHNPPPISVHRPEKHHQSTPEEHPPQDPPPQPPVTPRDQPPLTHGTTRHGQSQPSPPSTTNTSTWTC